MGKVVYVCQHNGCTCKLKKKVKGVHGTVLRVWKCPQHGGEAVAGRRKLERNEGKAPRYRKKES